MNLSEQQNDQKAKEELKKLGYPVQPNINKNNYDFELRKCLVDNNLFELAEQYGYDKNKQYTEQDVNELTEHINKEIKKTRKISSQYTKTEINDRRFEAILFVTFKFFVTLLSLAIWLILAYFFCFPLFIFFVVSLLIAYIYAICRCISDPFSLKMH